MEIYEETYEGIIFKIKEVEGKKVAAAAIPDGMDIEDALDMFADNLDGAKKDSGPTAPDTPVLDPVLDDVAWEFKWKAEDTELHGPHSSQKMADWQGTGFFDAGILVRKIGSQDFRDSKRIDFELYI